MRPVEKLQRDVLHLLLVDHAEVQAIVHVVLAQGPAPHARRHLDPLPLGPTCPSTGDAAAEGKTAAPAAPRGGPSAAAHPRDGRRRGGGRSGAASQWKRWDGPFSPLPPLSPLPSGLACSLLLPPPRAGVAGLGRPIGVERMGP